MSRVSVIIITKNEAHNIAECVTSATLISNDIIVADNGSTDGTPLIAINAGAKVLHTKWRGYGRARNEAVTMTNNDWVVALDADERVTPQFAASIKKLSLTNINILYGCKRENFLAQKKIKFGEWGRDKVYRLYNKKQTSWDLSIVHEKIIDDRIEKKIISGSLLHFTMKDLVKHQEKTLYYAKLTAYKYAALGKKATIIKIYISPVFSFIQNYIFRLGFLDGKEGFIIAYTSSRYIFLKYTFLYLLLKKNKKKSENIDPIFLPKK